MKRRDLLGMNEELTTERSPLDDKIECALNTRFTQLASGWTEVTAPAILAKAILNLVVDEAFPARSRARTFLEQLAKDRDLLARILAEPGRLLPDLLAKLKIPADEFVAELERMKAATAKSDSRELTDEEASGVVAAGTPGICLHEINQLITCFPYYS